MSTAATRHQQILSLTTKKATTQTFEDKVRQYGALFDGTKKDFSEVETIFDNLYHEDFVGTTSNGEELNKETKKELDKQRLAAGAKITNVTYTRIDYNKALVQFCLESEDNHDESGNSNIIINNNNNNDSSSSIHLKFLVTIKDKKIIEARHIIDARQCSQNSSYNDLLVGRDIIIAYCLSDCHSIRRGYQHGEAAIFKGRSKGLLQH